MSDVGDALVDVLLDPPRRARPDRLSQFFSWLKKVSRPPLGVRLISDDGGSFTGLVIVDENKPIAMLALRVGGSSRTTPEERPYDRRFNPGPLWREDDDIYR